MKVIQIKSIKQYIVQMGYLLRAQAMILLLEFGMSKICLQLPF